MKLINYFSASAAEKETVMAQKGIPKEGDKVYIIEVAGFDPVDYWKEERDEMISIVGGEPTRVRFGFARKVTSVSEVNGEESIRLSVDSDTEPYRIGEHVFRKEFDACRVAAYLMGKVMTIDTGMSGERHLRIAAFLSKIPDELKGDWYDQGIENFDRYEFLCGHCKRAHMQERFIIQLQIARTIAGIAFVIGSGWRCERQNAAVGGVPDSSHLAGLAADIMALNNKERFIILEALLRAGFKRIGIHKYYIHVDADLSKPQGIVYLY